MSNLRGNLADLSIGIDVIKKTFWNTTCPVASTGGDRGSRYVEQPQTEVGAAKLFRATNPCSGAASELAFSFD
jgi:hypothetical protein